MLINCYYYAPHNHSMLARHLNEDLAHIASLGTDIVTVCVKEVQLTNWHLVRLQRVIALAQTHGMTVHAVPNRWAGLTAGWLDGFDHFAVQNTDTWVRNKDGTTRLTYRTTSCTQHPKVRDHYERTLNSMLTNLDIDGVIWDEPTRIGTCYCDYCRAASPNGEPTDEWQREQFAQFLDAMSGYVKTVRPQATVSLFTSSGDLAFAEPLTATKHIDYIGSDGHIRSEDHQMHVMKTPIFKAHSIFHPLMTASGHKTMFLLEGQRHRDEDLDDYLANVEAAFALPMDQLMYYYSAHEMTPDKEEVFNAATWDAVKQAAERRDTH